MREREREESRGRERERKAGGEREREREVSLVKVCHLLSSWMAFSDCYLLFAECPSNMLVYLMDSSAYTIVLTSTLT